ncbi:MAG TPA: Ig domain-containing protein, partial [Candidatus Solibacter sp.]
YAGWVSDSVVGQYQVNVKLPGSAAGTFLSASGTPIAPPLTGAVQLPVVVTSRGVASQPGVTIWVAPRLKVAAPATLQGTAGVAWPASGNAVNASEGTPAYRYSITRGALPAGLALDAATGAISGTATSKGPSVLTVTATDSAASPLTGSVTFALMVN